MSAKHDTDIGQALTARAKAKVFLRQKLELGDHPHYIQQRVEEELSCCCQRKACYRAFLEAVLNVLSTKMMVRLQKDGLDISPSTDYDHQVDEPRASPSTTQAPALGLDETTETLQVSEPNNAETPQTTTPIRNIGTGFYIRDVEGKSSSEKDFWDIMEPRAPSKLSLDRVAGLAYYAHLGSPPPFDLNGVAPAKASIAYDQELDNCSLPDSPSCRTSRRWDDLE